MPLGYSGYSLKGHSLERGHEFLAASTINVCGAPSHQSTLLYKDGVVFLKGFLLERPYCVFCIERPPHGP